jgi:hypothetical protein
MGSQTKTYSLLGLTLFGDSVCYGATISGTVSVVAPPPVAAALMKSLREKLF